MTDRQHLTEPYKSRPVEFSDGFRTDNRKTEIKLEQVGPSWRGRDVDAYSLHIRTRVQEKYEPTKDVEVHLNLSPDDLSKLRERLNDLHSRGMIR